MCRGLQTKGLWVSDKTLWPCYMILFMNDSDCVGGRQLIGYWQCFGLSNCSRQVLNSSTVVVRTFLRFVPEGAQLLLNFSATFYNC